jgi:predicted GNAT family N-acyltransferase
MTQHPEPFQIQHRPFAEAQVDIAQVRQTVFQQEQGVDPTLDWDGQDPTCHHLIAYIAEKPVGVARLRPLADAKAKLERVAVLKPWRGQGIGTALVQDAIAFGQTLNLNLLLLHAQLPSVPFYVLLGFSPSGEPFVEANIPHQKMTRPLRY